MPRRVAVRRFADFSGGSEWGQEFIEFRSIKFAHHFVSIQKLLPENYIDATPIQVRFQVFIFGCDLCLTSHFLTNRSIHLG